MNENDLILTHILQCKPFDLVLGKPKLTASQKKQFEDYKARRRAGEPLQYILGVCDFMGLELSVNPSVLVPRPETEQLVDRALKYFKEGNALDLGCGSGNIAIALAKFVPKSFVVTIDRSPEALQTAHANARAHGVENQIQFIQDDFLSSLENRRSPWASDCNARVFDLAISNPPYIPTHQLKTLPIDVQKEPVMALDGGEDGLKFIRIIIKYTPYLLRDGACLMMEFGDGQAEAVRSLMLAEGGLYSKIDIFKDLAGRDRIVHGKVHH